MISVAIDSPRPGRHNVYSQHVRVDDHVGVDWTTTYQAVCSTHDEPVGPIRLYLAVATRDAVRHTTSEHGEGRGAR